MDRKDTSFRKTMGEGWSRDPGRIRRARIVLVLALSKRPGGELVQIIMDWLKDDDLEDFCRRYLDPSDLKYIRQV
ncbi:MAG: hypothetical protein JW821_15415 [Deltaproteobacteria bacterium]|nr:hypothetical protein [Deltaproteobacteria bacterium]